MIDLRRLQVLRAVHQHSTVTAAAGALHLTPSAVSHSLRELAKELKTPLIEPHGRGIRLTAAALLLVDHADALLARWEEARTALESLRTGECGALRMCGFSTVVTRLLAPAAGLLRRDHPDLDVQVTECESGAGFDLLLSGDTDLLLLTPTDSGPSPSDPRFDQQALMAEPLDLLVAADHPLTARARLALADAGDEPWILPVPGTCDHHHRVMVACAVAALVSHGLGVSLVPRIAALPADRAITRLPLTEEPVPSRQIMSCVRRGSREHPLIQHGLRALQDVIDSGTLSAAAA
ncbi:MAG: LysR family transcriptional regulator [Actinophytocola sp.]|nr:LysR family transcriptional regulator [Actinophytocola sp.]